MSSESNKVADPGGGHSRGSTCAAEKENVDPESADSASRDFTCNTAVTRRIADMMIADFIVILGCLELLSRDLLKDANDILEIKNGINQKGGHLGSVILRMFDLWLAKTEFGSRTYQTLAGHVEKHDPSLAEKMREPEIMEDMRRLAEPVPNPVNHTFANPAVPASQDPLSSAKQCTTIEIESEGEPSNSTEHVTVASSGHNPQPQSLPTSSNSIADSGSASQEEENQPLTGTTGTVPRCPHQDSSKHKQLRPVGIVCGAVLLLGLIAAGIWYSIQGNGEDLIPSTTTPADPDLDGTIEQVTTQPPPIENDPLVLIPLDQASEPSNNSFEAPFSYKIFKLTDPGFVSPFGCQEGKKQWLSISALSTQDWVKLKLPLNCRLEDVYGLEISGNINVRSLWYLLSKFKYLRHLKFNGLSVYLKPGGSRSNTHNRDRIRLEYLQEIAIQDGQVQPIFYELINYLKTPALQTLTIENTTLTIHVINAVQDLIFSAAKSEAFVRLNLSLVSVGTQKLFNSAMCGKLSHSHALEIHVKLPYLENVDYQGLKSNLMEFRDCAERTYYKYLPL